MALMKRSLSSLFVRREGQVGEEEGEMMRTGKLWRKGGPQMVRKKGACHEREGVYSSLKKKDKF